MSSVSVSSGQMDMVNSRPQLSSGLRHKLLFTAVTVRSNRSKFPTLAPVGYERARQVPANVSNRSEGWRRRSPPSSPTTTPPPRPFRWTKFADNILQSIAQFCQRTLAIHATS